MTTRQFRWCFEMTRHFQAPVALMALALTGGACSKPDVSEGDAAAVAPAVSADSTATDPRVAIADTARIQGNPDARVWFIMASDFQCPACKSWHDNQSAEIMRDYVATGKVRFAYTNYPIDELHPNARGAAEAAMCGGAQGKFWGLHDRLFAKQEEWSGLPDPVPFFRQLAQEAGIDVTAWDQCLTDDVMLPMINGDHARARAGGVNQTPYFFIGTQKVPGAVPARQLRPLIDAALAQAGGTPR